MAINKTNTTCRNCKDCNNNYITKPSCDPNRSSYISPIYQSIPEAFRTRTSRATNVNIEADFISIPSFCGQTVTDIQLTWSVSGLQNACLRQVNVYRVYDNIEYLIATSNSNNTTSGVEIINISNFTENTDYITTDNNTRPGWIAMSTPICESTYRIELIDCTINNNIYETTISFNMNYIFYFGYFGATVEPTGLDLTNATFFDQLNVPNLIINIEDDGIAEVSSPISTPVTGGRYYIAIPVDIYSKANTVEIYTSTDGVSYYLDTSWIDTGDILTDANNVDYRKIRYFFEQITLTNNFAKIVFKK